MPGVEDSELAELVRPKIACEGAGETAWNCASGGRICHRRLPVQVVLYEYVRAAAWSGSLSALSAVPSSRNSRPPAL